MKIISKTETNSTVLSRFSTKSIGIVDPAFTTVLYTKNLI